MPISSEQFNKGLDDTPDRILEFLKKDKELAYELSEIETGIGWDSHIAFLQGTSRAYVFMGYLNMLIDKGLVEKRTIHSKDYYKAK